MICSICTDRVSEFPLFQNPERLELGMNLDGGQQGAVSALEKPFISVINFFVKTPAESEAPLTLLCQGRLLMVPFPASS